MKRLKNCPYCSFTKSYHLRRDKRRCARCKREWSPRVSSLRLDRKSWCKILPLFLHGLSAHVIAQEIGLERRRVLRALLFLRALMKQDIPGCFSGTVEVDETYIGGRWRNRRIHQRSIGRKRGRGTIKTPVFGILCRNGKVWAEVVPEVARAPIQGIIRRRVKKGSIVCSDTYSCYTGIAAKGYVHRLIEHGKGQYSDKRGTHINGLEGFWGYLKRRLAAKGGIRKEKIHLYLAEYVWRYNHRDLTLKEQMKRLLNLIKATKTA